MNRRVLLVDDEPNVLKAYHRLLHGAYNIHLAENGIAALEMIKNHAAFAVIISDYKMPIMDGIEFFSQVRQISPSSIRIMLTGKADLQTAINAINNGAVFKFLTKPCSHEQIRYAIEEAIEQHELLFCSGERVEKEIMKTSQETMMRNSLAAITLMLSKRDAYTAQHQNRVAKLAHSIAQKMEIKGERLDIIHTAAKVHDVGKVFIPADILTRPGRLDDIEYMLIKTHSQNGYEILKLLDLHLPIARIVLQHHERLDGSGYPQNLTGHEIMLEARILAVADVMEAMHSHRPYRPAIGATLAMQELTENRGLLYDQAAVDACLELFTRDRFSFDN